MKELKLGLQEVIALTESERQRCEIWTRVMGYHRPLSSFNTGKKGEFHERTYFLDPCGCKQTTH